jgi:UDPglucose 6-dehydrogenase
MASLGNRVAGLDLDASTIELLRHGKLPVFEPGLDELVQRGVSAGQLSFTHQPDEAVRDIELLWIAYDTPVDDDDNAHVEHVLEQTTRTLSYLRPAVTVLVSSQLPVGSVRALEAIAARDFPEKELTFAYSPENLRLGAAIQCFSRPDRIVVGVRSERDRRRLTTLLSPITQRIEWMSVESAEMTKHSINAFLATSITFANEIATLCEKVGADAKEVERGLKTESRIGPRSYLAPGSAFSGGTLARDVAFLTNIGKDRGVPTPLLASIRPSNEEHKQWAYRKLQQLFPELAQTKVAIWGLTYKAGTDTLRRSLSVELCRWLLERGALIAVHDPAVKQMPRDFSDLSALEICIHPLAALKGARALVVSTEWPEYKDIPSEQVAGVAPGLVVLDANRFLPMLAGDSRLRYMAVGTPD